MCTVVYMTATADNIPRSPANPVSITLTVDLAPWTQDQRQRLLDAIASIEAERAGATLTAAVEAEEATGWTLAAYREVMAGLLGKYFAQAKVINEAIKNGTGYVSREEVYSLAGYAESRSLKGFTRPVNRVMDEKVEEGKVPDEAAPLLEPDYDPNIKGYQRARGFRVPLEVVKLLWDQNGGQPGRDRD